MESVVKTSEGVFVADRSENLSPDWQVREMVPWKADKPEYGSDVIVDLLNRFEIEYVSLNPGASFRGLHDSLVNYGGNRPEMIECPHEEIAVGMAHGYAKATGRPMACILHNLVGLLHGAMAIYVAHLDQSPVLILGATGPMDATRRRPRIDWNHTAVVQGNAVRDFVKWDDQPFSLAAVPDSFARGYRVAVTQPQGPVYLCYDVSIQEDPLPEGQTIELPDPAKIGIPTPMQGDPVALDKIAEALVRADHPVILTEYGGRRAENVAALVELAETVGAAVISKPQRFNFPNTHPLYQNGNPVLEQADVLLAIDVRSFAEQITKLDEQHRQLTYKTKPDCRLFEIGFNDLGIGGWSQHFQQLQPVELSVLADPSLAIPALTQRCRELLENAPQQRQRIEERRAHFAVQHEVTRQRWREEARRRWNEKPISTARLAGEIWEAIRDHDWVLTANTLGGWTWRLWDFTEHHQHPGGHLGTATQIGISLGVALAHKKAGRLVVDIQPDGDLMFDASALWVAAKHQIPMLAVMYNNRAYYNDWDHQIKIAQWRGRPVENAFVGQEIDGPAPDFAMLARSMGWYAEGPIEDPNDIAAALRRAIAVIQTEGRPALVDVVTQFR